MHDWSGRATPAWTVACDAARSARKAYLSLRRGYRFGAQATFLVCPLDVLINVAWPTRRVACRITLDPNVMLDRKLNGDLHSGSELRSAGS